MSGQTDDLANWQQPYRQKPLHSHIISLANILRDRKDKRYREGLLQGAVSFGVIRHSEWLTIRRDIDKWVAAIAKQQEKE